MINIKEVPMKPTHCAIARITDQIGRVLLLKRTEGDLAFQGWCFPGGRVEEGESPLMALCREVKEETGLIVVSWTFLFTRETESPTGGTFTVYCYDVEARGNITLSREHDKWRYISPAVASRIHLAGIVTAELVCT